ncbi:hypothetical protein IFM51744_01057 [Aspergillus udagawae]|nr:hypothetical protein IFM51744_01057 [Aspergillus udagawae]
MIFTDLIKRYRHAQTQHAQTQKTLAKLKEKAAKDRIWEPTMANTCQMRIGIYEREQTKGFAILHRIKALETLSAKETGKSDGDGSDPPPYTSTTIDKEISTLKILYREHLGTLQDILKWQPNGSYAGPYRLFEFLIATHNEKGQTLAWEKCQHDCAMRGGCYGRACGCCNQPLRELYIPLSNGKRKGVVYGHCTRECLCCNQFHGCYVPDAQLPEIDPALRKAIAG